RRLALDERDLGVAERLRVAADLRLVRGGVRRGRRRRGRRGGRRTVTVGRRRVSAAGERDDQGGGGGNQELAHADAPRGDGQPPTVGEAGHPVDRVSGQGRSSATQRLTLPRSLPRSASHCRPAVVTSYESASGAGGHIS